MDEISEKIKYEHDFAQDGPTFDRLKRAHPHAGDAEAKQAIVAAVKFDDDCFEYFHTAATTRKTSSAPWRGRRGKIRLIWRPPTATPAITLPSMGSEEARPDAA